MPPGLPPAPPVALSTASVYPESARVAFELAAGRGGLKAMVLPAG